MNLDWPRARLGEHVDLLTGFPFRSERYTDSGIRLLRGDNIAPGQLRWEGAKYWPSAGAADFQGYELVRGDVVLAMDRPWIEAGLKAAFVGAQDVPALLVQRVARLRAQRKLDQRFLRYLIASREFEQHVLSVQTGTTVPHLSGAQIKAFRFALPTLGEQQMVSAVLGVLDDKIEVNRRMNETLESLVSAHFDSRLGQSPVGTSVEDVVELARATVNPQEFPEEVFEHYSLPAYDASRRPRREVGGVIMSTKLLIPSNSVLLSKLNPRIPRLWIPGLSGPTRAICSTEFLVCVPREPVDVSFLFGLFSSRKFRERFASLVTGTSGSHQRVKASDFLALRVPNPPPSALPHYSWVAKPLLDRMRHNLRESETLAQLRDTLLPKLISGELRLRDAEELAESTGSEPTQARLSSGPRN